MNCKPNDLVRVISTHETILTKTCDKIIKVTTSFINDGKVLWKYEGAQMICGCGCYGNIEAIADKILRPIRDSEGEDESLSWIRNKSTELENV